MNSLKKRIFVWKSNKDNLSLMFYNTTTCRICQPQLRIYMEYFSVPDAEQVHISIIRSGRIFTTIVWLVKKEMYYNIPL